MQDSGPIASGKHINRQKWAVFAAALVTLGSGILNIVSVIGRGLQPRVEALFDIFPLEFVHLSRSMTLLLGFALVVSAINIYKRKQRVWVLALALSTFSVVFHLTKGLDYEEALVSLALCILLIVTRRQFTVKSNLPNLQWGLLRFATAILLAFAYGVAGFWFLERREFGLDFDISDAVTETARYLAFIGDPRLVAQTHHAAWFETSLYLISAAAVFYALWSIFQPVYYQFRTHPIERLRAKQIVEKHGRSSLDFFKYWPDKSFFFSATGESFIAYRVGGNFALALADPVGPEHEIEGIVNSFADFCAEHDWHFGFHQTLPDFLPIYTKLGLHKIKVGDDAITDLGLFSMEGRSRKELRHTVNKLESEGVHFEHHEPPINDQLLARLTEVSDDWLTIPGRRERQFTLGVFELDYVRQTRISVAVDAKGIVQGFLNEIPSYCKGEATIDLMRHRADSPEGVMDYLIVKLVQHLKQKGHTRFNFGMAPMAGFQENENATREERAIHYFFQNLNFLFSYRGLKHFKAKYASSWEPRYAVVPSSLDLPQLILALRDVSEIKGQRRSR
jgi:phosphatidylglycerol lysyltransferase